MLKPKLREIRTQPVVERGQQGILLTDPLGISQNMLFIPGSLALLLALMDGTRDFGTLRTGFELRSGTPLSDSMLEQFLTQLDEAVFLDNERYTQAYELALNDYRSADSRPPVLVGKCYPAEALELSTFLQQYLEQIEDDFDYPNDITGLISPHIDFERGGHIYAQVWSKARAALQLAELIVILGTDHNDAFGQVTLTHQNYRTPWGVLPTARDIVGELAREIGESAFRSELNHRSEHSIEAALVWLHYFLGDRQCQILPVLCGSLQPFIECGDSPLKATHIAATIDVLKRVSRHRRTIIVAAADLAHQGPVFGDPSPLGMVERAMMAKQDKELIQVIISGHAGDFFTQILNDRDRRHICGIPPIYITLSILSGASGLPFGYDQCPASNDGTSLVSICGILYRNQSSLE